MYWDSGNGEKTKRSGVVARITEDK